MVSQDWADGRSFVYDYDARGRLAGVSLNGTQLVANIYDYQERRVSRTQTSGGVSSTVHSIYDDSGQLLAEHDGATGAMLREYVWLKGALLAIVEGPVSAPVYSYVQTGHLNEPVMVTDAAGQVTSSITRDPWGNAILLAGSAELSLGYSGQWHDQEAGLYQNWHREYDPTLGRYIQTDPIGLAGGTNLYVYVDGNPVNAVDPEGRLANFLVGGLGGGSGGLAIAVVTGDKCYGTGDFFIDVALGAGGIGLVSKLNQIRRVSSLRRSARHSGMSITKTGSDETWAGTRGQRLRIKHEGSKNPKVQPAVVAPALIGGIDNMVQTIIVTPLPAIRLAAKSLR